MCVQAWAQRFALLGDETRLRLLNEMHTHPDLPVADLALLAGVSVNCASQALRRLREAGWVASHKTGRVVRYQVVDDAIVHRILHELVGAQHTH